MENDNRLYYATTALPKVITSLLSRGDLPFRARSIVNKTFQGAMRMVMLTLDIEQATEMRLTFSRLSLPTLTYWKELHNNEHKAEQAEREKSQEDLKDKENVKEKGAADDKLFAPNFVKSKKRDAPHQDYFNLINYFGNIDGYQAILRHLRATGEQKCVDENEREGSDREKDRDLLRATLDNIKYLLQGIDHISEFMVPIFEDSYLPKVHHAVLGALLGVSGREMTMNERFVVKTCRKLAKDLLKTVKSDEEVGQSTDKFDLEVALKNFNTTGLENRFRSLKMFKKMINRTLPPEESSLQTIAVKLNYYCINISNMFLPASQALPKPKEPKPPRRQLSPTFLLGWLQDNKILEQMCEFAHPELIRNGSEVFLFFCCHGVFKNEHIDKIWDQAAGKHESVKHAVYTTLMTLFPHFTVQQATHLFSRIQEIPLEDQDIESVALLAQFTQEVYKIRGVPADNPFGIEMLWLVSQGHPKLNQSLSDKAFEYLLELLKTPTCSTHRLKYLSKAAENFSKDINIGQSLRLMEVVIATFPKRTRKRANPAVEYLDTHHNLSETMISSIVCYKEEAKQNLAKMKGSKKRNLNAVVLSGKQPHLQQLQLRLNFLQFLLFNGSQAFSNDDVDRLWLVLVEEAITAEERELFFEWVGTTCVPTEALQGDQRSLVALWGSEGTAVADATVQHVFGKLADSFDRPGFALFRRLFLYINLRNGQLKLEERPEGEPDSSPPSNPQYYSVSLDLNGTDKLWSIALEAEDDEVGNMAINLLNMLHQNLSTDGLKQKQRKIRESHVAACMTYLSHAVESLSASDSHCVAAETTKTAHQIHRCLVVLKNFVQEWDDNTIRRAPVNKQATNGSRLIKLSMTYENVAEKKSEKDTKGKKTGTLAVVIEPTVVEKELPKRKMPPSNFAPKMVNGRLIHPLQIANSATVAQLRERVINYVVSNFSGGPVGGGAPVTTVDLPKPKVWLYLGDRALDVSTNLKTLDAVKLHDNSVISVRYQAVKEEESQECINTNVAQFADKHVGFPRPTLVIKEESDTRTRGTKKSDSMLETLQKDPSHPIFYLSQKENFEQLYKLLQMDSIENVEQIGYQCWELLDMLLSVKVPVLFSAQCEWAQMLNPAKPYLMLYSLQVIHTFIHHGKDKEWATGFKASGGVSLLVKILVGVDTSLQSICSRKSIHLLLSDLRFFLLGPCADKHNKDGSAEVEVAAINQEFITSDVIEKILAILSALAVSHLSGKDYQALGLSKEDDGEAAACAMEVVSACVLADERWQHCFFGYLHAHSDCLRALLLVASQLRIRTEVAEALHQISSKLKGKPCDAQGNDATSFILGYLWKELDEIDKYPKACRKFFLLLNSLLSVHQPNEHSPPFADPADAVAFVVDKIVQHQTTESTSASLPDQVLIGFMLTLESLVRKHSIRMEHGFVQTLLDDFLFHVPQKQSSRRPKCKTEESRRCCFRLILELCRHNDESFAVVVSFLGDQFTLLDLRSEWSYSPLDYERSKCGFVGLKNQGATCYMNSLLQQLYLIPNFRCGILAVGNVAEQAREHVENVSGDWDVFAELQVLFANLQESQRRFYDTRPFCSKIRDYEGNPVNTNQQMDANEFFNMLFDKLDNVLKRVPAQRNLLKSIFSGTVCNQLICKECPHGSEREESFFSLSVEMKNKKNIMEALDLFVEGEMLSGDNKYSCEICQRGVDTLKRSCIQTLPNMLLIHLKRFEFKMDIMRNVKLNDYCEFPMVLDMEPYTKEGLHRREAAAAAAAAATAVGGDAEVTATQPLHPAWYYRYELVGIVVHMGTADSGHYYTLRRENSPPYTHWFEYNDMRVTPYDPKQIGPDCFGGTEEVTTCDAQQQRHIPRCSNAYILFYQRMPPQPDLRSSLTSSCSLNESLVSISDAAASTASTGVIVAAIDNEAPPPDNGAAACPPAIMKFINLENQALRLKKYIFHQEYFDFTWDLCGLRTDTLVTLKFCVRFFFEVYSRAKEKTHLLVWAYHIKKLLGENRERLEWFLQNISEDRRLLKMLLVHCPLERNRAVYVDLVMHVVAQLLPCSAFPKGLPQKSVSEEGARGEPKSFVVVQFIDTVLSLFKSLKNKPRQAQVYEILLDFAKLGDEQREFLVFGRSFITRAIDFFVGRLPADGFASPVGAKPCSPAPTPTTIGASAFGSGVGGFSSRQQELLVEAVAFLACDLHVPGRDHQDCVMQPDRPVVEFNTLLPTDLASLKDKAFIPRLLREGICVNGVSDLCRHLCYLHKANSQAFMDFFLEGMTRMGATADSFRSYYKVMRTFMKIGDPLRDYRCKLVSKALVHTATLAATTKDQRKFLCQLLQQLGNKDPEVRDYLMRKREKISKAFLKVNYRISC
eukprot:TRINITY_DN6382_c0_g1_i1.p2 TRINITY_DN6382_c0_g1~~TRINITY_DN6382_c0_g1_i1.p2  ORF type:complete len:2586 (-),score=681.76 TRINITY_DN6382_c0_g1_i1:7878-14936(-)